MAISRIPPKSDLKDQQFISVAGPDGLTIGYRFDKETCTLYGKESNIIIPPFHGLSHIAEDPVPDATTDFSGLMSGPDKAKLDALTTTRLGVLGFAGAGFADDGGFLQGDIILAAGSEFLSIERIGNVIRFTADAPIPLNCGCEECAQIFWIQDESDVSAIRPPSCAGKIPDVNVYGELKVYQLPENTIVNPANPTTVLNQKSNYPALVFKRFDDAITPGQAEFDLVLSRNSNSTTNVGWAMTPGATGVVQNVWFMGLDNDGNQIRFDMHPEQEPDLLGAILYKGHTITRQMAVVTGYTASILSSNQYRCKLWSVNNNTVVGDEFTATNVWQYNNPENNTTDLLSPQSLVLDATCDLLPIGTLVQIWEFQAAVVNGQRLVNRFFNIMPKLNPATLWGMGGALRFGDLLTARDEVPGIVPTEITANVTGVTDLRLFERGEWGITGFEDRLYLADDGEITASTDEGQIIVSDSVLSVVTESDPNNPTPNFKVTAKEATNSPLVVNGLVGRVLVFTSGFNQDVEFPVVENSIGTITVHDPDDRSSLVQVGDTFDVFINSTTAEPSGVAINNQNVADIDPNLPGLVVSETPPSSDQERPVYVWHRGNHKNVYVKALIGRPDASRFPPIDILLRAPIDSLDDTYLKVVRRGTIESGPFNGNEFVVVKGVDWKKIPPVGTLRILTNEHRNQTWNYQFKAAFDRFDDNATMLVGFLDRFPFDGDQVPELEGTGVGPTDSGPNLTEQENALARTVPDATTVVQIEHEDYTATAVRLEFSVNDSSGGEAVQLQVKAGVLDMSKTYDLNLASEFSDDFVRGFTPGTLSVSKILTQSGFLVDGTETVASEPSGFKVYDGGFLPLPVNGEVEKWNELELMYRDGELWVWWNRLLVPPDPALSAALPTPVSISTPYFPLPPTIAVGKVGFRLWPGALLREVEVRDQLTSFNEFVHGQLELNGG